MQKIKIFKFNSFNWHNYKITRHVKLYNMIHTNMHVTVKPSQLKKKFNYHPHKFLHALIRFSPLSSSMTKTMTYLSLLLIYLHFQNFYINELYSIYYFIWILLPSMIYLWLFLHCWQVFCFFPSMVIKNSYSKYLRKNIFVGYML